MKWVFLECPRTLLFNTGLFLVPVFLSALVLAAGPLSEESMENTRMRKRFGIGLSGGGSLSALGIEVDVSVTPDISLSGGLGTGLDYSTLMFKGKYYLLGDSVSPYFALGFARWWTDGTKEKNIGPSVLVNRFLSQREFSEGFSVWMVYPALGVQFLHAMGLSLYAEVQYLFKLFNFSNGTYAGMGVYWYF